MGPQKYARTIRHTPLENIPWSDEKDFVADGLAAIGITVVGAVVAFGILLGVMS